MKALPKNLFRAYDIRGMADEELTSHNAYQIGRSIGSQLQESGETQILLGRDGRISSPRISKYLSQGLLNSGCHITDLGQIPTPVLYFAIRHLKIPNGIVVTGSHNAAEYNGIKIVFNGQCLHTDAITDLYKRIIKNNLVTGTTGKTTSLSLLNNYIDAVSKEVHLKRRLRIALDCSNGVTGLIATTLFEKIGCEVHALYCDLNGHFPNHSPDPTEPKNLQDLQNLVIQKGLDIGIAFDGDGDRMIAVDGKGKILWPDRIMALLAKNILQQHPDRNVVYDVKCSQLLPKAILNAGGNPLISISGHSLLKAHMKKTQAIMGGEFSGHIILNDRSWGYADDGLYVAARLLELLSCYSETPTQIFAKLPDSYSTPEYKLYFDSPQKAVEGITAFRKNYSLAGAKITCIDGLRADFDDCWGLARSSNTSPTITLRFEATTQRRLNFIQDLFRKNLQQLNLDVIKYNGFDLKNTDRKESVKVTV